VAVGKGEGRKREKRNNTPRKGEKNKRGSLAVEKNGGEENQKKAIA